VFAPWKALCPEPACGAFPAALESPGPIGTVRCAAAGPQNVEGLERAASIAWRTRPAPTTPWRFAWRLRWQLGAEARRQLTGKAGSGVPATGNRALIASAGGRRKTGTTCCQADDAGRLHRSGAAVVLDPVRPDASRLLPRQRRVPRAAPASMPFGGLEQVKAEGRCTSHAYQGMRNLVERAAQRATGNCSKLQPSAALKCPCHREPSSLVICWERWRRPWRCSRPGHLSPMLRTQGLRALLEVHVMTGAR